MQFPAWFQMLSIICLTRISSHGPFSILLLFSVFCLSVRNVFIFLLSFSLSRSNARRDQIGPYRLCDDTWLGNNPQNPLAMGQYVNNRPKTVPANVAYQEFDIPFKSISPALWKNLPNVWYNSGNIANENSFLRSVALVSLREIEKGEEVFSSYFTVIH